MTKNQTESSSFQQPPSEDKGDITLQILFPLILKNWYWFLISIVTVVLLVRFYIEHTMPVYRSSATILINTSDDRASTDNSHLLLGFGLSGGMQNLENQLMVIKSRDMIESTLEGLSFEIEYYYKTIRNKIPLYPVAPIRVVAENELVLPKDVEFSVRYIGNNSFIVKSGSKGYPLEKTAVSGDTIETPRGRLVIECRNPEWFSNNTESTVFFVNHSRTRLVNSFLKRLIVEKVSREGSILKISMEGTNRSKDVDFINKHIEGFQTISLNRKNEEADRRIMFIDNQLVGISDSLSLTESRLQQFRSSHRVMDLSVQGQSIIGQVTVLENERARLNLEANYYDYLADYLAKNETGEIPIVPITMGITDAGLTRIVEELADLQGQLSARGAGEMNPLQRNLEQRVRTSKEALRETLNGLRRANSLARSENQEQINRANAQASALPVTERQLLGIERKFKLNDELYTYLLEIRAEQEMQKASNRADSEVIDPADARFSPVVAPDKIKLNIIGLIAALGIPLIIIIISHLFNNRLKYEDIKNRSVIPVVGNITHMDDHSSFALFDYPNSGIAESFRILRSRMQFLIKDTTSPVVLVTSSLPGDGKTFIAMNLASAYSLLDKKTVLVGFDLRRPRLVADFKIRNDRGISTWLIGKDNLQDIIQKTRYDNLYVIPSGPIPPNPSELTALGKTNELFALLRKEFDYIIVDSSPIGIVSDTYYLASMADACLLVVRCGVTLKDAFDKTVLEIDNSGLKGVSIVINDITSTAKHYGYGEKYGYTDEQKRTKRAIKRKGKIIDKTR